MWQHNRLEIAHAIQTIEKRTQKAFRAPMAVARKLDSLRSMPTESIATSSSEDLSVSKHDGRQMTREVCVCRGGICTSECHCLSRFGGCDVNCPCKGCQPLPVRRHLLVFVLIQLELLIVVCSRKKQKDAAARNPTVSSSTVSVWPLSAFVMSDAIVKDAKTIR